MKIIFMGTPEFSAAGLEALIGAGHQVVLAVTQPDRQKGRGKAVQFPPVKECALAHDIPVIQPKRIRDEQWEGILREYDADIGVVIAFGQILPEWILQLPRLGCINVHASLLPKYRGAAPIQQCIIDGEKKTGVTIIQMDAGIDTGDMILKREVPIEEDETGGSLHDKLASTGASLLLEAITLLEEGKARFEKQEDEAASYVGMMKKEMGNIDWSRDAVSIERLIRGLSPWPSAYTQLGGKTLKLWQAEALPVDSDLLTEGKKPVPGQILSVTKQAFFVACGEGMLKIKSLQLEGKKRMDAEAFLRGYTIAPGQKLGGGQ